MKIVATFVFCFTALTTGALSDTGFSSQPGSKPLKYQRLHIDRTRRACGLDCILQKQDTQQLLGDISQALGVNRKFIDLAIDVLPKEDIRGDDAYYAIPSIPGYKFCAVSVRVISLMSANDQHLTEFHVGLSSDGIPMYAYTQNPGAFQGQSSIEADIEVIFVRSLDLPRFEEAGVCTPPPDPPGHVGILNCKGNPCPPQFYGNITDIRNSSLASELQ